MGRQECAQAGVGQAHGRLPLPPSVADYPQAAVTTVVGTYLPHRRGRGRRVGGRALAGIVATARVGVRGPAPGEKLGGGVIMRQA